MPRTIAQLGFGVAALAGVAVHMTMASHLLTILGRMFQSGKKKTGTGTSSINSATAVHPGPNSRPTNSVASARSLPH